MTVGYRMGSLCVAAVAVGVWLRRRSERAQYGQIVELRRTKKYQRNNLILSMRGKRMLNECIRFELLCARRLCVADVSVASYDFATLHVFANKKRTNFMSSVRFVMNDRIESRETPHMQTNVMAISSLATAANTCTTTAKKDNEKCCKAKIIN